jgi:hypothetical protein
VGLLLASCSLLYNKASFHPPILFLLSSLPLCLTSFLECESGLPAHRFPAAHQHPTQHNTTVHAWPPYPLSRLISTCTPVRQQLLKFNPQDPPLRQTRAGAFLFLLALYCQCWPLRGISRCPSYLTYVSGQNPQTFLSISASRSTSVSPCMRHCGYV